MKYQFTLLTPKDHFCGINIGQTYTNVSKKLYELMGEPESVSIQVDAENKAVKLTPVGSFKLRVKKKAVVIPTGTLKHIVGTGRFLLAPEDSDESNYILTQSHT